MTDFSAAAAIAWRVFEIAPSMPNRRTDDRLLFLRDFPHGSCDSMAYATAAVLFDRGLGDWWVVTQNDGECDHVWLEWRSHEGEIEFSIDATAHQFEDVDAPFVGPGPSPSRDRFDAPRRTMRSSELPTSWPRYVDIALLEYVRTTMA